MLFNNYINLLLLQKKNNCIYFFFIFKLLNIYKKKLNCNFFKSYNLIFFLFLNSFNKIYIYKFLLKLIFFFKFKFNGLIVYLPKKIIKYTLIKSPFIFKKGRDQFELIFEKIIFLFYLDYFYNNFFIDYLLYSLQLNYVNIKIKKKICVKL